MKPRPMRGRASAPALSNRGAGAAGAGGFARANSLPANPVQQVVDPGFADDTKHTIGGAGAGTTAVAGGVLTIASTTNVYYERPAFLTDPLFAGTYQVTFTISSYASGSISIAASASATFATSVDGTARSADGTYVQNISLSTTGYIGLKGQGAAVVNSMVIDNLTVIQVA